MRPAVKHWLFLILLAVSLAAMIAFALWQMSKARQHGPAGPNSSASVTYGMYGIARRAAGA